MVITNRRDWIERLRLVIKENYEETFRSDKSLVHISVFRKLNICNENFYTQGDEFVISSGTLIYKNQFGKIALQCMLEDYYKKGSITELRKYSYGSYTVAIKYNGSYVVFSDETHTHSFYYYIEGKDYLLCDSFCYVLMCIGNQLNEKALLERGVRRCIMSNNTPINNVFKLRAQEAFFIDSTNGRFYVKEVKLNDYHQKYNSREDAVLYILQLIKKISAVRSIWINRPLHFLTGGIDSRLEFGIYNMNKDIINIGYWIGNDAITNGTEDDVLISSTIAENFGCKFIKYHVDQTIEEAIESINIDKIRKYGEFSSIYCGNTKWFSIFENLLSVDSLGFGYLGETLRPLGELDHFYHLSYSLDDYVKNIYCRTGLEKYAFNCDGFYEFVKHEHKSIINEYDLSDILDIDTAFRLFQFSRFDADCILNNFANLFLYSFPIFGQKEIADAINSIPYEWMRDEFIPVALMKEVCPKLLDVNFYSHHRTYMYVSGQEILKKSLKFRMLDMAKVKFYDTPIYTKLYLKYLHKYIRPQTVNNDYVFEFCRESIKDSLALSNSALKPINFKTAKGIEIGAYATFCADLRVFDTIYRYYHNK